MHEYSVRLLLATAVSEIQPVRLVDGISIVIVKHVTSKVPTMPTARKLFAMHLRHVKQILTMPRVAILLLATVD